MVPTVMFLDWAHDEGGEFNGWGTDGKFFGKFLESPTPFLTMWTIFGLSGFFSYDNRFAYCHQPRSYVLLANSIFQAVDAGILIQHALYRGDMDTKNKWSVVFVLLWISLGINSAFKPDYSGLNAAGLSLYLVWPGIICAINGMIQVFGDRKRGDYWMQNNQQVNPNPIVYSAGLPLFMLGWILLSWQMSLDYGI
jgi:hypothetical protein